MRAGRGRSRHGSLWRTPGLARARPAMRYHCATLSTSGHPNMQTKPRSLSRTSTRIASELEAMADLRASRSLPGLGAELRCLRGASRHSVVSGLRVWAVCKFEFLSEPWLLAQGASIDV